MLRRFLPAGESYPRQFWLLFWGMLISSTGASMIWPFLMIYLQEKAGLPQTVAAILLTINALMGILSAFIAGPILDKAGRKKVMVVSLAVNGLVYIFLSRADTLALLAVLMALSGAFSPLYRVGADAMMADLIPPQRRTEAYSLLRLSYNLGVALGPTIGGFLAAVSYGITFLAAAGAMITFGLLIFFLASETLPRRLQTDPQQAQPKEKLGGYPQILRDTALIRFMFAFTLNQVAASFIWLLMSVYAKHQYGVLENQYGFIPATNAILVVLLQMWVTHKTRHIQPLWLLMTGSLLYAVAVGSVALATGFSGFWVSIVILTAGELVLIPNATTYVANLAGPDKRGRYMGIYGLSWSIAAGIGPVMGSLINDHISPRATWYGGGLIGLASAAAFLVIALRCRRTSS